MIRVNLYLSTQQMERLKRLSVETGLSVSELMRRILDEALLRLDTESKSQSQRS